MEGIQSCNPQPRIHVHCDNRTQRDNASAIPCKDNHPASHNGQDRVNHSTSTPHRRAEAAKRRVPVRLRLTLRPELVCHASPGGSATPRRPLLPGPGHRLQRPLPDLQIHQHRQAAPAPQHVPRQQGRRLLDVDPPEVEVRSCNCNCNV